MLHIASPLGSPTKSDHLQHQQSSITQRISAFRGGVPRGAHSVRTAHVSGFPAVLRKMLQRVGVSYPLVPRSTTSGVDPLHVCPSQHERISTSWQRIIWKQTWRPGRFIDQTGADVESVYGGQFQDDPGGLELKHDRKGLLSAANMGPSACRDALAVPT